VFGGIALALAVAIAGAIWFELPQLPFLLVCVAAAAFSVVGDLAESMMKRFAGLKDSGRIFPGHGGVLDRLDSVCAAAPVFVLGLYALEGTP
jgi:phosphatidate cytidylyltransferase